MSTSDKPSNPNDARAVSDLARGIEETRAGMTATITQLEQRLPQQLGGMAKAEIEHLETRVKVVMKEGLEEARGILDEKIQDARGVLDAKIKDAKDAVHEEIAEARSAVKEQLHETKDLVTRGLSDARDALKQDIQGAIAHTKQSIRDATLGRVEDIATQAGDVMTQTRDTLVDTIRQNPIPAAVAGIGIAWLLMNRSSASRQKAQGQGRGERFQGGSYGGYGGAYGNGSSAHDAQHAVSDGAGRAVAAVQSGVGQGVSAIAHAVDAAGRAVHSAGDATTRFAHDTRDAAGNLVRTTVDTAGNLMHTTFDAAGNAIHTATSAVGQLAHQAQYLSQGFAAGAASQARRVERGLESTLESNPLALGAAALMVGAAVGYALPRTQKENELMGEMRGRLLDGASHLAQDASHSLLEMAGEATDSVKHAIGEAAR